MEKLIGVKKAKEVVNREKKVVGGRKCGRGAQASGSAGTMGLSLKDE
jgi:hypothetical protein